MYKYKNVIFEKVAHDCFLIESDTTVIYTDPFKILDGSKKADYIFITHEHFDHFSQEDIKSIVKQQTVFFVAKSVFEKIVHVFKNTIYEVLPGQTITHNGLVVKGVASYNTNKFRSKDIVFHPKENLNVGFIIEINGIKIYHVGDSDYIKEMDVLKDNNIDILLIPVSGTYVMEPSEAASATKAIEPKIVIPMHYGSIIGDVSNAQEFKRLAQNTNMKVEII